MTPGLPHEIHEDAGGVSGFGLMEYIEYIISVRRRASLIFNGRRIDNRR